MIRSVVSIPVKPQFHISEDGKLPVDEVWIVTSDGGADNSRVAEGTTCPRRPWWSHELAGLALRCHLLTDWRERVASGLLSPSAQPSQCIDMYFTYCWGFSSPSTAGEHLMFSNLHHGVLPEH